MLLSGASTVRLGAVASITPLSLSLPMLPAGSFTSASTFTGPSGNATGTSTSKLPSAFTVVVNTWVLPALSVTVMLTSLPGSASVVPLMVGVVSLVTSGTLTSITGAVVSITLPLPALSSLALALLPALSFTSASTVYLPSGNATGTSTSYVPSAFTVVVNTWVAPVLSVTVKVTTWPSSTSVVVPVINGVLSLLKSGASTVMAAVVSTEPVSVASALLPAGSATSALTV